MARRGIQAVLEAELRAQGVAYTINRKGKHPRLQFTVCGIKCLYFFPGTPSCPRAEANSLAGVRRMIRDAQTKASVQTRSSHD